MELTQNKDSPTDTAALLADPPSNIKHIKRCSTFQLCILFIFGAVFGVITSNLDRFIDFINDSNDSNASSTPQIPNFGHEMYQYFDLNKDWRTMYFNWGSWGGIPTPVMDQAKQLYDEIADCPNCYFSFDRSNLLVETLQAMAKYLGINQYIISQPVCNAISTKNKICT